MTRAWVWALLAALGPVAAAQGAAPTGQTAAPTGQTAAAATPSAPERFALSGHNQLRVNDQLAPDARFYRNTEGVPRLLVVAPGLKEAFLIASGAKPTASLVDPAQIGPASDDADAVMVPASPASVRPMPVILDGLQMRITFGASRLVVEAREPLLGELKPDEILAYMPEYRRNCAAYQPGRGDLRLLETLSQPTDVEIFFGTWCPHCEQMVPRLLRVIQQLSNPNLKFHFHGLPVKLSDDPLARQYKVDAIPTGVIRRGTETVARLEAQDWRAPESALATLLFGDSGSR